MLPNKKNKKIPCQRYKSVTRNLFAVILPSEIILPTSKPQTGSRRTIPGSEEPIPNAMKKILISITFGLVAVAGAKAQTLLFSQNFTSSGTLTDYVSSASPSNGQWNAISTANATVKSWSIASNSLQISSSGGSSAAASRTTDFAPVPTALSLTMNFNLVSSSASNPQALLFSFGNNFTTSNSDPTTSAINTRFAIGTTTSNQWFVRDIGGGVNSGNFSGSQAISLYTNSSGSSLAYTNPSGLETNLASGKWDLWVGTSVVFSDRNTNNSTISLSDFKISNPGTGSYVAQMTDFAIYEIVPEPSTWALMGLGIAFMLWRVGKKRSEA
jgi:hypothetical protein